MTKIGKKAERFVFAFPFDVILNHPDMQVRTNRELLVATLSGPILAERSHDASLKGRGRDCRDFGETAAKWAEASVFPFPANDVDIHGQ